MHRSRAARLASALVVGSALCALLVGVAGAEVSPKAPLRGLVDMGAYRFVAQGGNPVNMIGPLYKKRGLFGGIVVIATWSELQPDPGAAIPANNTIDRMLAAVRVYNQKFPATPLAVKLRVWAGFEAPDWAKGLDGDPLQIQEPNNGKMRTVGRFWSPSYAQAWQSFQQLLAERYDSEPLIHEVAVTSCMTLTAEPFFLATDAVTLDALHAAGFSDAAYRTCLANAVNDYSPWQSTVIEFPFNPFRSTDVQPWQSDLAFTKNVMTACRQSFGVRCVLDNHDLDYPVLSSIRPLYAFMKRLGPGIEFQTYHETPKYWDLTIRTGVRVGASSIELWQDYGGFPLLKSRSRLLKWGDELKANPTP